MNAQKIVVAQNAPKTATKLGSFSKRVLDGFTGNSLVANPPVPLAKFADDIKAFDEAHLKVTAGVGTGTQRDVHELQLRTDLDAYRAYAQLVARSLPTLVEAIALIESVGMKPRRVGKREQAPFSVTSNGAGAVRLAVKAVARKATYYWQYSIDGVTWVSISETLRATTTLSGLEQYTRYQFRFRTLTSRGMSDWSEGMSFTVL